MRVLLFILTAIILSTIACQQKSVPVITDRKAAPPVKTKSNYPPLANITPDTGKGKALLLAHCNKCHGTPMPQLFTAKTWDIYLFAMFPRTRLSNEEAFHVRAYVMANARQ